MTIDINKTTLNELYYKAEVSFNRCISDSDNTYLNKEIAFPIEQLELRRRNIKVVFDKEAADSYKLEISLNVWQASTALIGLYIFIEDDKGNAVDDSLVFF